MDSTAEPDPWFRGSSSHDRGREREGERWRSKRRLGQGERLNDRIQSFEQRLADRNVEMVEWGADLVEGGSWMDGGEGHIVGYERFGGKWCILFKRVRGVRTLDALQGGGPGQTRSRS